MRRGIVLVLTLLAVVLVGALIVATHSVVALEHNVAAAAIARQRAFAASEHGLWSAIASWDAANSGLEPGATRAMVVRAARDSATVTIVRLNDRIYWVVSDAIVADGRLRARRRTGINVRLDPESLGAGVVPLNRSWVEIH